MPHTDKASKLESIQPPPKKKKKFHTLSSTFKKKAIVLRHSEAGCVVHVDQQAGWLRERLSLFLH